MPKVIITNLSEFEKQARNINSWPIWTKEVSVFDWYYDTTEECFIVEGEIIIKTDEGKYHIKAGDFVTFQAGLKCVWNITKPVKKHYNFIG